VVNLVHLHLLLNHVPTVGTIVAFGLLLLAFAKKSDDLLRGSFALFFAIALVSLATYMTGHAAEAVMKGRPGVSAELISVHQSAAFLALVFMEATGVAAWFGLWQARKPRGRSKWPPPTVLLLSVITIALMANAANIGGEITHPEILAPGTQPSVTSGALAPYALRGAAVRYYQFHHPNAWPTLEVLHFIGLSLLFGVVLVGNLRILGFMRNAPFIDIHRLLPWGVLGFVINSVTGMLFFVGQAFQYVDNVAFHLKVLFMLLAGANVLYLTLFDDVWALGTGDNAPATAKLLAASQIFLWLGVIYFGRMLPYIGGAF
jgi:uncharacterized membrane protein